MTSLRIDQQKRAQIEMEIAGAAVCWEPALKLALTVLPVNVIQDEWARVAFYWAAAQSDLHHFDGVANPDRLLAAMDRADWPKGLSHQDREAMTEALWTPRMYDMAAIRTLCETLRDEHQAWRELHRVHVAFEANRTIQQLLRETPPPLAFLHREAGIWERFKR